MNNEYADRQQAIKLRLAGQSVEEICRLVGRSPAWFHIWWRRYRAAGPTSLLDLTRVNIQPRRITPELERTIVSIRQRLASQLHPGTRYSLIGANVTIAGSAKIGKNCYIGSGSSIINGIEIKDHTLVGMGSNVINSLPYNSKAVGNPARQL